MQSLVAVGKLNDLLFPVTFSVGVEGPFRRGWRNIPITPTNGWSVVSVNACFRQLRFQECWITKAA